MAMLEVTSLGISFGGLRAVDELSMKIEKGGLVGLIGPNGAGKTTAFNMLTGVYRPTDGGIRLDGQNLIGKKPHEICKLGVARTFQNIRLFSQLSVLDNVKTGLHNQITYSFAESMFHLGSYRKKEKQMDEKAMELLGENWVVCWSGSTSRVAQSGSSGVGKAAMNTWLASRPYWEKAGASGVVTVWTPLSTVVPSAA